MTDRPRKPNGACSASKARHVGGYHKKPKDFITVEETVALMDDRLRVILRPVLTEVIADYDRHLRARVWWRRALDRLLRRGLRMGVAP
ncbi:MAG TPA: hypothetical protein VN613_09460 [Gemmatimonadaceae bacterium]|nr:hypothetical protein [Gemmatimonadaceae bacterium]